MPARRPGARPRLAVRRGDAPGDGRAHRLRRPAAGVLRRRGGPGPHPGDPPPPGRPRRVHREDRAAHAQRCHPRALCYFTPPPLSPRSSARCSPRARTRNGCLARRPGRRVRRGGGRPLAVRPRGLRRGELRAARLGRRDGQLHRAGARERHPPRALRGATRPPRGAALEGVRVYSGDQAHFSIARALDELGFPPETLVTLPADDRFRLHAEPVAEAIAADRARGACPWPSAPWPGPPTRDPWTSSRTWPRSRSAKASGSTSMRPTAGGPPVRARCRARPRPGRWPTPSPSTPTSGSSRPTTSAALLVRDGAHLRQTFDAPRVLPWRRVARGRGRREPRGRARRPAQLLQAGLRGHAPLARAQAVGDLEAPRDERPRAARGAHDDIAAYLAGLCATATTSRRSPTRAVRRVLPPPPRGPGCG